jgi:AcrR family transcriptional regulator
VKRTAANTQPPEPAPAGYRKGDEARERILVAALKVFGSVGLKAATTRRIAEEAGVNLPALTYYFGGKEGLYRACAREIVARYERRMLDLVSGAHANLRKGLKPEQARAVLKQVMSALAGMMVGAEETEIHSAFVLREMAERGPAFSILYDQLWAPGVDLTAGLISRAMGERTTSPAARVQALLLISGLSAFSTARPVALKYLAWPDAGEDRFALILKVIERQIDGIR